MHKNANKQTSKHCFSKSNFNIIAEFAVLTSNPHQDNSLAHMLLLPGHQLGWLKVVQFLVLVLVPFPQVWEQDPWDQGDQPPSPEHIARTNFHHATISPVFIVNQLKQSGKYCIPGISWSKYGIQAHSHKLVKLMNKTDKWFIRACLLRSQKMILKVSTWIIASWYLL